MIVGIVIGVTFAAIIGYVVYRWARALRDEFEGVRGEMIQLRSDMYLVKRDLGLLFKERSKEQ